MKIGYARVSTDDQNIDLQRRALVGAGCDEIFTDQVSGASEKRPGLDKALARCVAGDVLVVWKLDRLGRSLSHLIAVIKEIGDREVGFQSLSESIDTTTAGGRFVFHMMGAIAEFERALITERTTAGIAAARKRGRQARPAKSLERATGQTCPVADRLRRELGQRRAVPEGGSVHAIPRVGTRRR